MKNEFFGKINLRMLFLGIAFVCVFLLAKGFYFLFFIIEIIFLSMSLWVFKKNLPNKSDILYKPLLMNISGIFLGVVIFFFEEYKTVLVLIWLALYWVISGMNLKGENKSISN